MEPRDAATVMLVRDTAHSTGTDTLGVEPLASTIEVFMLQRNLRSAFVAGASVFPGGAVDADDRRAPALGLVDGLDATTADARLGCEGALGFWVAAIRESFEEAGVLLARDAATGAGVDPGVVADLGPARAPVAAGQQSFAELIASRGLVLDAGPLRVFARWITPEPAPRRYDTWFFVAPAPPGHTYEHDFDETVASEWVRPGDALARARRGELELIYPTFRSLQVLERFSSTTALLAAVDAAWRGPPPALRVMSPGQGWQVRLPGDEPTGDDGDADAVAHSRTHRIEARASRARVR